ncbi:MAG: Crp/Fnr family transcriptional regulator [Anaerolineales bacterium]|nr:MAG: Crp/Fnr family transcriptional regulator [Anaerolineales bacterium]
MMAPRKRSPLEIKTTEAHLCSISLRLKILGQVPFFRDLTASDHEWINSLFHEKDFDTDEVICLSGDAAEQLFIIADGRVKLLQHSLEGKEILLDLLTPGEFFGALSGLGNDVYPETAQAHTNCCILVIGRETFQHVLQRYPAVALKLIDIMAGRLRTANERVHQLSALSIEARIASILLMLADKFGERKGNELLLQVPLSREDLAGMSGATTESASRVMSRFQKDGLIRSGRKWVAVIDRAGLEALAGKA